MYCLATQLKQLEEDIVGLRDEWRALRSNLARPAQGAGAIRLVFSSTRQGPDRADQDQSPPDLPAQIAQVLRSDDFVFDG